MIVPAVWALTALAILLVTVCVYIAIIFMILFLVLFAASWFIRKVVSAATGYNYD